MNTKPNGLVLVVLLAVGIALVWGGTALGLWLAPLVVSLAWALWVPSTARQYLGALIISLGGYAVPLIAASLRLPLGRTSNIVAAIMGFGHQGVVVWAFTGLLAIMMALAGAWLGHAVRGIARPAS